MYAHGTRSAYASPIRAWRKAVEIESAVCVLFRMYVNNLHASSRVELTANQIEFSPS